MNRLWFGLSSGRWINLLRGGLLIAGFIHAGQLAVAETSNNFENLATGREHAAAGTLVIVQCVHELQFFARIITFASRRIDLSPAVDLGPPFYGPPFDSDRFGFLSSVALCSAFTGSGTSIDGDLIFRFRLSGNGCHGRLCLGGSRAGFC